MQVGVSVLPGSTLITPFPFTPNVQTYFLKQQGCRNDPLPNAWFGNQLIVACSGLKDFDPIQFMDIWIANQDRKSVSPMCDEDDTPDISKIEHWFLDLVVKDLSTESLTCVLILLDGKPHLFV